MKILFCGDIVGKNGRKAIAEYIPSLKKDLKIDVVVANAENAAHGFGITPKIYDELSNYGIDVFTLGNHFLDQYMISEYLNTKTNIIRPLNFSNTNIGKGYTIYRAKGINILFINVLGQLFMKGNIQNPFLVLDNVLKEYKLKEKVDIIFVDIHAEATSEKNALFLYLNGRVSAVLGTHTHIPTNDYRILSMGTAVQTDVGMCGDYNGVVGMDYNASLQRFIHKYTKNNLPRLAPATKFITLCATLIEFNIQTGLSTNIKPIIMGDILQTQFDLK